MHVMLCILYICVYAHRDIDNTYIHTQHIISTTNHCNLCFFNPLKSDCCPVRVRCPHLECMF